MDPSSTTALLIGTFRVAGEEALIVPIMVSTLLACSALATAFAITPALARLLATAPPEPALADYLPFLAIRDDGTIESRRNTLTRVWHIPGRDHQGANEEERTRLYNARRACLDALSVHGAALDIRAMTFRTLDDERAPRRRRADVSPYLRAIDDTWTRATSHNVYSNHHFLCVSAKNTEQGREALESAERAVSNTLQSYGARRLRAAGTAEGLNALTPYAWYLSPATRHRPQATSEAPRPQAQAPALSDLVQADEVQFLKRGRMRFSGTHTRYAALIGVRGLSDVWTESLMLEILRAPCECTLVHAASPLNESGARFELARRKRSAETFSIAGTGAAAAEQIREASEILAGVHPSGTSASLIAYCLTIVVYAESARALELATRPIESALQLSGATPVREGIAADGAWWSALPTFESLARPWQLFSIPIANAWIPHSSASGIGAHAWAPHEITRLRTADGGLFRFTWHASGHRHAAGNVVIIGPTGGGKTTLLSHLTAQTLMLPDSRTFVFDRFSGTEIFAAAAGGHYVRFDTEEFSEGAREAIATMNPFLLDNTAANRAFLIEWLTTLANIALNPTDFEAVQRAVRINYEHADPKRRSLRNVYGAAFDSQSPVAQALRRWTTPGDAIGEIFNASQDSFRSQLATLVGYDCTEVFASPVLAAPVISYLAYQIRALSRAQPRPTLIYVDETAPMLQNATFRETFARGLREGRKLRQVWACAFQVAADVELTGIGDTIRTQCPTQILLRNPEANKEDYRHFDLTRAEHDFIRGDTHTHLPWAVLVKRAGVQGSTVVDTSLDPLGDLIRCYSSDARDVQRVATLTQRFGRDKALAEFLAHS